MWKGSAGRNIVMGNLMEEFMSKGNAEQILSIIEELELECGKNALIIQDLRDVVKYYQSLVIVLSK
jgi:hypothetical protein